MYPYLVEFTLTQYLIHTKWAKRSFKNNNLGDFFK